MCMGFGYILVVGVVDAVDVFRVDVDVAVVVGVDGIVVTDVVGWTVVVGCDRCCGSCVVVGCC